MLASGFDGVGDSVGRGRPQERNSSLMDQPLAARMRPRTFEEFVGQSPPRRSRASRSPKLVDGGHLPSIDPVGPGRHGQDDARAPARRRGRRATSMQLSAVSSGVADARKVMEGAEAALFRTVLFVDEVHRWSQGAAGRAAAGGRGRHDHADRRHHREPVLRAEHAAAVAVPAAAPGAARAEDDPRRCCSRALDRRRARAGRARRDARRRRARPPRRARRRRRAHGAHRARGRRAAGRTPAATRDRRCDASPTPCRSGPSSTTGRATRTTTSITAFIKSHPRAPIPTRRCSGSARMIEAGEDPRFIVRRMVILASEDVGLADPRALLVAVAAARRSSTSGCPRRAQPRRRPRSTSPGRRSPTACHTALGEGDGGRGSTDPVPLAPARRPLRRRREARARRGLPVPARLRRVITSSRSTDRSGSRTPLLRAVGPGRRRRVGAGHGRAGGRSRRRGSAPDRRTDRRPSDRRTRTASGAMGRLGQLPTPRTFGGTG